MAVGSPERTAGCLDPDRRCRILRRGADQCQTGLLSVILYKTWPSTKLPRRPRPHPSRPSSRSICRSSLFWSTASRRGGGNPAKPFPARPSSLRGSALPRERCARRSRRSHRTIFCSGVRGGGPSSRRTRRRRHPASLSCHIMLELREVSVVSARSGEVRRLLDAIGAHFAPGQLHAVVGPSGCGKSTLLKAIAGVRQPNEGSMRWSGRDLDQRVSRLTRLATCRSFGLPSICLQIGETVARVAAAGRGLADGGAGRADPDISRAGRLAEIAERRVGLFSGGKNGGWPSRSSW